MLSATEVTSQRDNVTIFFHVAFAVAQERSVIHIAIETITLSITWASAILGNAMVCVVIQRSRRMQSTTNYFVMSLAVTDILMTMISMPFVFSHIVLGHWVFGLFVCKALRFTQFVFPSISVCVLLSICVDRFYTIKYPLSFKIRRKTAKRMIACSSIVPIFVTSFMFYFFKHETKIIPGGNSYECPAFIQMYNWLPVTYISFVVLTTYLLPCIAITVVYLRVFLHVWKFNMAANTFQRTMNPVPRAKVHIVKMLMLVTLFTMILYLPFYTLQIWSIINQQLRTEKTLAIAASLLVLIACAVKPAVYLFQNSNFRRGCQEVLCRRTLKCYRGNSYAVTSASSLVKSNRIGVLEHQATSPDPRIQISTIDFRGSHLKIEKVAWSSNGVVNATYL